MKLIYLISLFLLFVNTSKATVLKGVEVTNLLKTSYGELSVESALPFVSGNAVYGFIPSNFRTFTEGAGYATATSNVLEVSSGTALADYGTIRSFRSNNYKTGQGSLLRAGAKFNTPTALTWSGVGAFNVGDEYSFGYNGTAFGIWHRYNGKAEVQELVISTAATGAEDATVTVNGTDYVIALTSGTTQHNAFEIAAYLDANGSGFEVEQVDNSIRIDFTSDGDKTGAFTFSSATAVATFHEKTQGTSKTSDHVAMSSWNKAPNGFSGFDPSKGNAYQIEYQNGYGDIKFYIENPETSDFELVHIIKWANAKTFTNLTNPAMHIGLYATSIGATTPVTVEVAYITSFIHGTLNKTRNPRSFTNTKLAVGTTLTNILTIRNSRTYNGRANQVQIEPLSVIITNDGTKQAECTVRGNPTVSGETNFQEVGNNLVSQSEVSGTTVSGGRELVSFPVASKESTVIDLKNFEIAQPPSLRLVVACAMVSGTADITASLVWYEDL
jgi:hypothetical protein